MQVNPQTTLMWVVIVTYNSADTIAECLTSVLESSLGVHVIVVDNGSTDDTIARLRLFQSEVSIIESGVNGGYAAGCNLGLKIALQRGAEYIAILNPDTTVAPDALTAMVNHSLTHGHHVVSPLVVDYKSGLISYAGASFDLARRDFSHHGFGQENVGQFSLITETGRLHGGAVLVSGDALTKSGFMDETYFLYWEDTEWNRRFRNHGFQIGLAAEAIVRHHGGHSTGGSGSPFYEYYYLRNKLRFLHTGNVGSPIELVLHEFPAVLRTVASSIRRRGVGTGLRVARAEAWAIADFLRGRHGRRPGLSPRS